MCEFVPSIFPSLDSLVVSYCQRPLILQTFSLNSTATNPNPNPRPQNRSYLLHVGSRSFGRSSGKKRVLSSLDARSRSPLLSPPSPRPQDDLARPSSRGAKNGAESRCRGVWAGY